jgi:hypothetical protein
VHSCQPLDYVRAVRDAGHALGALASGRSTRALGRATGLAVSSHIQRYCDV